MKLILQLLGLLIIIMGISLLIKPELFYRFLESNLDNSTFYFAAIIGRFLFGLLLMLAAKVSKYPIAIKLFGLLSIIAAISFFIIGPVGFQDFLSSLIPFYKPYGPMMGLIGIIFGGFIIHAFLGERSSPLN